ncbi:MAG: NifX-associated nitrogen fixation protein [Rhodospirillaceae bacterium]
MTAAPPPPPPTAAPDGLIDDDADFEALKSPFVQTLIRVIRAHDAHGAWDNKNDQMLLRSFIVTKEQRKQLPIIGDPDPRTLMRLDQFYAAVGLAIENRTGLIAQPLIKLSHEGWGRVVLIAGKLVVISRSLRDVHRFGFPTLAKLAEDGAKLVEQGVLSVEAYPEAARA